MILTSDDLQSIREIIKNEVGSIVRGSVREELVPVLNELEALRNDINEIYDMIADLQKSSKSDKSFKKLSLEEKILKMHSELVEAANQAGVKLPSH